MRTRIPWVLVVWCVGLATAVSANDSAAERETLSGLPSLSVVVEQMAPLAEKNGLSEATLQSDAQRKLQLAGISVTPDADAYLYVRVTVADPGSSLPLLYNIEVALMQEVTLPRGLRTRAPLQCQTWWLNSLGMTGPDRLRVVVSDRVGEFVDRFTRAYRSANPKP